MKILFVHEKCGYFGGVEQNVADSAKGLRGRGHACALAYGDVTERDPDGYAALFEGCFRCSELSPGRAGHPFEEVLRRVGPDVVYFHKVPGLPPHPLPGARAVRMVHDHDLCCPRRHKYFALSGRVCRHRAGWRCWADGAFLRRDRASWAGFTLARIGRQVREMRRNHALDRVLVGSQFMKEELLQNGFPPEKVRILPPVVRLEERGLSPVPGEPRILYVGQLIRGKGVDLLLHAMRQVSCDFTALIAGEGNARRELEALCQGLGLADRVRFLGWVGHEGLGTLYSWAKVVAVPSRWPEPFGMVGIEAMRHGRAVVAFAVGGIPDWLEHGVTGLLAPEQDTAALARSLERALTDTELAARLGRNAHESARARYSFEGYLDRLESHLCGEGSSELEPMRERETR